jgi:hypothetical protein
VNDLSVPKRRVEAEIALAGGERRPLVLFVAESAHDHDGPERVSDLLCRGGAFFPAADPATGDMSFLSRDAVALVRLPRDAEPGDADELTIPTEHEVVVELRDGARARGIVSYVLPPEHSRLVDFLNDPAPFFRLFTSPDEVLLVSRQHVARVVLPSRREP